MFFATEFPVKTSIGRPEFAAQAIAWVRGMKHSSLFDGSQTISTLSDEAVMTAANGEKLTLKECRTDSALLMGVRHEIKDDEGRVWRTEVTLRNSNGSAALRTRTQCVLATDLARVQMPRKPYFVTLALDDGWAEQDGRLPTGRVPIWLGERDVDLAAAIVTGDAACQLPAVYVSRHDDDSLPIEPTQLDGLAHRLSGVAHVVVEPSRRFSVSLMEKALARNPYKGSVGICATGYGVVRKHYIGYGLPTADDLLTTVSKTVAEYASNRLPRIGVEWQDIVEASAGQLREKAERSQIDYDAWFALRDEENRDKDAEIASLRAQLDRLQTAAIVAPEENGFVSEPLLKNFGPELYRGELGDRVRRIVVAAANGEIASLDARSRALAEHITRTTRWSGGAAQLEARIKAAGRDSSRADERIADVLISVGFNKRQQGGHPVYVADSLMGIAQQTLSSSSSDYRAGRNAAAQVVRDLNLADLKD